MVGLARSTKSVCLVSCQRSPEPVYLRWKAKETTPDGDFYVGSGPRTDKLSAESASEYIRTRFAVQRDGAGHAPGA